MPDALTLSLTPSDRQRAFKALFTGVAVSTTGFLAANTVNSLIAEDLTGRATWSGLPAAASVLGTASGATILAAVVRRTGPRTGLTLGYVLATAAVALAAAAILSRQFALFVATMFLFGGGYGANRLARYVTADLYPPDRRATMIGWIVWASTIGAVAGPALLAPARELAIGLSMNGLVGPYLVCALACALSAATMRSAPAHLDSPAWTPAPGTASPLSHLLLHRPVTLALTSMVSGQFVMVLLMTVTPVHIRHEGHGLGAIGLVISAHTLGMYALSPLTGRLGDRHGRRPLLVAAIAVLTVACVLGATLAARSYTATLAALFLLGVGWNLGFVAGSALLTDSVTPADRVRVQGFGDTLIWGGGALASIGSGWMLEHAGFAALSAVGAVLALSPIPALWRLREN